MTISAVIFDFDGTLVDTETVIFETWQERFWTFGCELEFKRWQSVLGTSSSFDPAVHLQELRGRPMKLNQIRAEVRADIADRVAGAGPRLGVRRTLLELRSMGLRLAVASSSAVQWVETWLGYFGLRPLFSSVSCRDHVEDVKPSPELYLLSSASLGLTPSECLAVEDSPNGIHSAIEAGMRCVSVPNKLTKSLVDRQATYALGSFEGCSLVKLARSLVSTGQVDTSMSPELSANSRRAAAVIMS